MLNAIDRRKAFIKSLNNSGVGPKADEIILQGIFFNLLSSLRFLRTNYYISHDIDGVV